jgi:hypothetical protein
MYFTEQPMSAYPAEEGLKFGATALMFPNKHFDPVAGSRLYNEYLEHYIYAEEMGIEGIMLNEHHVGPGGHAGGARNGQGIRSQEPVRNGPAGQHRLYTRRQAAGAGGGGVAGRREPAARSKPSTIEACHEPERFRSRFAA